MIMTNEAAISTPEKDLEDRILNPSIAKSEAEWWARRVIFELRSALAASPRSEREKELEAQLSNTEERHAKVIDELKAAVSAVQKERDEALAQLAQMREALEPFAKVGKEVPSSVSDDTCTEATTVDAWGLLPVYLDPVLIGDFRRAATVWASTEATAAAFVEGIRREALEEAAKVAESVSHPVGASDGCGTRAVGTSSEAAQAIRSFTKGDG